MPRRSPRPSKLLVLGSLLATFGCRAPADDRAAPRSADAATTPAATSSPAEVPSSDASTTDARPSEAPATSTVAPIAQDDAPTDHAPPAPAPIVLEPFPGVRVVRGDGPARVEVDAVACLDAGWLEQVACTPGTREHESLVVVRARPSHVHAALLMAGLEPGHPGSWSMEGDRVVFDAPRGAPIEVRLRYARADGSRAEESVRRWIRDAASDDTLPDDHWVFGGSAMLDGVEEGDAPIYAADASGSVVGLVTFGDEVVGYARVWADEEAVESLAWEVRTEAVPPPGTPVVLVLEVVARE